MDNTRRSKSFLRVHGEDVIQSDEVLVFSSLCKSNVVRDLSRSLNCS